MVKAQKIKIFAVVLACIPLRPLDARPTPTMLPTELWVVDMGRPNPVNQAGTVVNRKTVVAFANSAAKPVSGSSLVTL